MSVKIEKSGDSSYHFAVKSRNGKILCVGMGYNNKQNAEKGARAAMRELVRWNETTMETPEPTKDNRGDL